MAFPGTGLDAYLQHYKEKEELVENAKNVVGNLIHSNNATVQMMKDGIIISY